MSNKSINLLSAAIALTAGTALNAAQIVVELPNPMTCDDATSKHRLNTGDNYET